LSVGYTAMAVPTATHKVGD